MSNGIWRLSFAVGTVLAAAAFPAILRGEDPRRADTPPAKPTLPAKAAAEPKPVVDAADKNIVYLTAERDQWLDKKNKQVVMKGKVAVREGNLEMFACPQQSKEYESIIAVSSRKMEAAHAGLLALGAKPGHPAKFDTKFIPATGTEIEVTLRWIDKDEKKHEARGQDWVRNLKTGKPLEYPWVFGGSGFRVDPDTGEKTYRANDGDFICVVNFPDSTLDLSFESPKDWSEHIFEPFTERIPPKGTDLELVLTPKLEKEPPRK